MICPFCKNDGDKVVDSRSSEEGMVIRRRRECLHCGRRYTSYERIEHSPIKVIKKDGNRYDFDVNKIRSGIEKACQKRQVSVEAIDEIVRRIDKRVMQGSEREVSTEFIGTQVMKELKDLDHVAYVRFASVYREFKSVDEFMLELKDLINKT